MTNNHTWTLRTTFASCHMSFVTVANDFCQLAHVVCNGGEQLLSAGTCRLQRDELRLGSTPFSPIAGSTLLEQLRAADARPKSFEARWVELDGQMSKSFYWFVPQLYQVGPDLSLVADDMDLENADRPRSSEACSKAVAPMFFDEGCRGGTLTGCVVRSV